MKKIKIVIWTQNPAKIKAIEEAVEKTIYSNKFILWILVLILIKK